MKKEIPAEIVFEDDSSLAFLEIHPSAPGHTMVIPKKHGVSILDFDEKELGSVMNAVKKVASAIERGLGTDSLSIGINHLEKKGVPHLHIHIIPRFENDGGGIMQTIVNNSSKEEAASIAKKIRGSFN